MVPPLLTPGAAETLATKVYRLSRTQSLTSAMAIKACLTDYRNPVPKEVMDFQIALAMKEASDIEFIPPAFRNGQISTRRLDQPDRAGERAVSRLDTQAD